MKLTNIPNYRIEDFPSQQEWIGKLFIQENPFVQSLSQVLDQNIDYSTNIKSVTRSYDITTFQVFSFTWAFPGFTPVDLRVVKALKGSTQTPTILQAAWAYNSTDQSIRVTRMIELTEYSDSNGELHAAVIPLSGRFQFTLRVTV